MKFLLVLLTILTTGSVSADDWRFQIITMPIPSIDPPLFIIESPKKKTTRWNDTYVIMHTADWCRYCRVWKDTKASTIKEAGYYIIYINNDDKPAWMNAANFKDHHPSSLPAFWIMSQKDRMKIQRKMKENLTLQDLQNYDSQIEREHNNVK